MKEAVDATNIYDRVSGNIKNYAERIFLLT